jgi:head-tail adaptor
MLLDMLNLTTVQVSRVTNKVDGMGGMTESTVTTTLSHAAIWQAGSMNRYLSDRVTRASTHVLACVPSAYTWTQNDRNVTYGGRTYKIVGRPDDIMQQEKITVVPLELQT